MAGYRVTYDECCRWEDGKESVRWDEARKQTMKGILMQGSPHSLMISLLDINNHQTVSLRLEC